MILNMTADSCKYIVHIQLLAMTTGNVLRAKSDRAMLCVQHRTLARVPATTAPLTDVTRGCLR
jgi:hypothetical protein